MLIIAVSATANHLGPRPWAAQWVAPQCCPLELESGQRAQAFFTAQNIGQQTWYRSVTNLGTSARDPASAPAGAGRDRNSLLYDQATWPAQNRAGSLAEASVPPGGIGTFPFTVRAPSVATPMHLEEYFEPVVEGGGWMGADTACWPNHWSCIWLPFDVQPAAAPAVTIASLPREVRKGSPVQVVARATDNVGIGHVDFSLGEPTRSLSEPDRNAKDKSYASTFDTSQLDSGTATIAVRAFDHVGHSDAVIGQFRVVNASAERAPAPAQPNCRPGKPCKVRRFVVRTLVEAAGNRITLRDVLVVAAGRGTSLRLSCIQECGGALRRRKSVRNVTTRFGALSYAVGPHTRFEVRSTSRGRVGRYLLFSIGRTSLKPAKKRAGCLTTAGRHASCAVATAGGL